MKKEFLEKLKIPAVPGVYFFRKGKDILYIGKATSLRDRVRSYFAKDLISSRGPLIVDMVFKSSSLKWEETPSVLEALILEAHLIKKHQPYYNVREKDDKSFNFVCITKEKLPKVVVVRGRNLSSLDNSKFQAIFGPFTNGGQLKEALKLIRRIFPFLDDKSKDYLEFYKQINLVPDLNNRTLYMQNIRNLKLFFQGKKKQVIRNLKKEMLAFAKERKFEQANELKRQLFALLHVNDVALIKEEGSVSGHFSPLRPSSGASGSKWDPRGQKITGDSTFRIEAYDIAHMAGKNMVGVMTVIEDGDVNKNEYRKFKIRTQANTNDTGALAEVLSRRLTHQEWSYPSLIVVDGGTAQINAAKAILYKTRIEIPVVSVLKDERHKPKDILGDAEYAKQYKKDILLANSEAHRFAITYHKKTRARNFLK